MTPHQMRLVRHSFSSLIPPDNDSLEEFFGEIFYARLFALDPSLRPLFKGDLHEQGHKLLQTLRAIVDHLEQSQQLLPETQALGERHSEYGVKPEHYHTVGEALIWTLAETLGDDFTPEVREAWLVAYTLLAQNMQNVLRGGVH